MATKFNPPERFDFTKPSHWPEWKEQFTTFRIASKLFKDDGIVQVHSLLYAMGPEATKVYKTFKFDDPPAPAAAGGDGADAGPQRENPRDDYDTVLALFDTYFVPKKNVFHERARFYARNQQSGESVESFLRAISDLSLTCNFANAEEQIRDRLVLGLSDQEVAGKLQLEDNPTLETAINTARHYELVNSHINQAPQGKLVDSVQSRSGRRFQPPRGRGGSTGQKSGPSGGGANCGNCGRRHAVGACPARGKQCRSCSKYNHFANVCRSTGNSSRGGRGQPGRPRRGRVHDVEQESDIHRHADTLFFDIDSVKSGYEPPWRTNIIIGDQQLSFKLDSGADLTVISRSVFEKQFPGFKLQPSTYKLRSAGQPLPCLGRFKTTAQHKDKVCEVEVFVADSQTDCLLGRTALVNLDLVRRIDAVLNDGDPVFGNLDETPIACKPVKIVLKDNHEPYSVPVARRIPLPLLDKVKEEIDRLESCQVIEKINDATDWCAPIVPIPKKNNKGVRLTTDFKRLNKAVKRERYMLPSLEDITHKLAGSTIFSKLDTTNAFFQLPLDPDSARKTTFITPFGRYFYKRLPQGITSAPEIFQKTMEGILEAHKDHTICFFDDILIHSKDSESHEQHLSETLQTLRDANVKLNRDKCEFCKDSVKFLGFHVSRNGLQPDPDKTEAIIKMTAPTNVQELRRFLGMTNFLGRHLENLSTILHPLNTLLGKDSAWCWGPPQVEAFNRVKTMLTTAPTLAFYDATLPTTVSADASSYGLGAVLLQLHDGVQRPVAYCSRSLTQAEQRYAQIEKELLASVWACERFSRYIVGLEFTLLTDHKPLIPLINTKDLSEIPVRCQRLMIRLSRFAATAEHCPGKEMFVPDTLSRSPIPLDAETAAQVQVSEAVIASHVDQITSSWPVSDRFLQRVREESVLDVSIKAAMEYTINGWPAHREDVTLAARDFYAVRGELSVVDGLLTYGERIVIPHVLQKTVLKIIHQGHQGITKCRERAKTTVWWPRISTEIKDLVSSCASCLQKQPSQRREPLKPATPPERPFQRVGTDILLHCGTHYLVLVDCHSRYIEIAQLANLTSCHVISKLKTLFARHGIPETVISDNGTQFTSSEFQNFAQAWNFTHVTSSQHYPQSNGQAESAVKIAKSVLSQDDPAMALLVYRSTPLLNLDLSPAELAFGRRLRTTLPTLNKTLMPRLIEPSIVNERDTEAKQKQKYFYDRHHGVRPLPPLQPGDPVLIKSDEGRKWRTDPAEVVSQVAPRSFILQQGDRYLRRNRRHLLRCPSPPAAASPSAPNTPAAIIHHPAASQPQQPQMSAEPYQQPPGNSTNTPPSPVKPPPASAAAATTTAPAYITRSGRSVVKPARYL